MGIDYSDEPAVPQGMKFGDWLVQVIEAWAAKIASGHVVETENDPYIEPRQIILSLNPAQAVLVRHKLDKNKKPISGTFHTEYFVESDLSSLMGKNTPPCSRQTHITEQVLIMAGTLLADTRAKRAAAPLPTPVPGRTDVGDATPDKIEAAGPGSHDGLVLDQPTTASASASAPASRSASAFSFRTNRLRPVNRSKANPSQTYGQPTFALGGGHSGDRPRDAVSSTCNP